MGWDTMGYNGVEWDGGSSGLVSSISPIFGCDAAHPMCSRAQCGSRESELIPCTPIKPFACGSHWQPRALLLLPPPPFQDMKINWKPKNLEENQPLLYLQKWDWQCLVVNPAGAGEGQVDGGTAVKKGLFVVMLTHAHQGVSRLPLPWLCTSHCPTGNKLENLPALSTNPTDIECFLKTSLNLKVK